MFGPERHGDVRSGVRLKGLAAFLILFTLGVSMLICAALGAATAAVAQMILVGGLFTAISGALAMAFLKRWDSEARSFATLHGGGAPAALTDARGRVLRANAAFGARGRSGGLVGVLLDDMLGESGGALAYRLTNRAAHEGAALECAPDHGGRLLSVRAESISGGERLIWTLAPVSGAPVNHDDAEYGFARFGPDGGLLPANGTFAAMPAEDRDAAASALWAARDEGRGSAALDLSTGPALAVILSAAEQGGGVILFPKGAQREPATENAFFVQAPIALAQLSAAGEIRALNPVAAELLGPGAAPGAAFSDHVEGLGRPITARIEEAAAGRGAGRPDLARALRRDRDLYLQIALKAVSGSDGDILAVMSDATDMEAKERQFVQSQKMQAVGQLAGGVAHDFNNLLTAILGHCDLLAMRRDETDPDFADLTQIRQNATRAAALVRQLLAFSRQQNLDPQQHDLKDVLGELSHLLDRLIGERVTLRVLCDEAIWPLWIDARQFEQVILNLVVNARDAMPQGGEVSITCRNETLNEELKRDRAVVPVGDYVRIEIADQGSGMNDETRAKIFEPFFTTKRQGEGTGLGLSTAYGIVKQTGGFIFVDSKVGEGAVFTILIPRLDESVAAARAARRPAAPAPDLTGCGRVLLVEDEAPVRTFAARALRLRGYEVIEAESAEAALDILVDPDLNVDLVVSDVVMPGLDGPAWVREARRSRPELSVVFTSGYAEDMLRKGLDGLENCAFLAKPFSLEELGAAVKAQCAPLR